MVYYSTRKIHPPSAKPPKSSTGQEALSRDSSHCSETSSKKAMTSKRDYAAVAADEHDEPVIQSSNKRRREQQNSKSKGAEGKPDPTYGQRCAFPGLDDDESAQITDDDLEFEESGDALAYLRAVR